MRYKKQYIRQKRAFSLIELLVVIVVMATLSVGFNKIIHLLYIKKAQAKYITKFSFESQILLDQISGLLSKRVHYTTIAYDPDCGANGHFEGIDQNFSSLPPCTGGTDFSPKILEWYAFAYDARMRDSYQGYIKGWNSLNGDKIELSKFNHTNFSDIESSFSEYSSLSDLAILIPPRVGDDIDALRRKLGWHGEDESNETLKNISSTTAGDGYLKLENTTDPDNRFRNTAPPEKIYLLSSAYSIALGANLNQLVVASNDCGTANTFTNNIANMDSKVFRATLFLFRGFRPWDGETFCMDKKMVSNRSGKVSIIAQNVTGFKIQSINHNLVFQVKMDKDLRGSDANITFNKQKVIF